jgi:hypothetical protein
VKYNVWLVLVLTTCDGRSKVRLDKRTKSDCEDTHCPLSKFVLQYRTYECLR